MANAIEPKDEDFEVAFARRFMGGPSAWASIKSEARKAAAERLLRANIARQHEISALLTATSGVEWMALQDEFTKLLAEHDALSHLAFPSSQAEVPNG